MSYLMEKYAVSMSKDDVIDLFLILEKAYGGNISRVCQECGIQRKTRYDWPEAHNIKLSTKKRVLKLAIETDPERTLSFLLSRSKEATIELLSAYLSHLYAKAMVEDIDPRSFVKYVNTIQKIKNENAGLIWELEEELGDMMSHIRERSRALRVSLPEESVDTIRPSHMLEIIPSLVHEITRIGFGRSPELARNLGIPERLVQVMSEAIVIPFGQTPEAGQSILQFDLAKIAPTTAMEYPIVWGGRSQ